ncbi:MAG: CocE/NonD family hydrolase C-terminal non-catalytic domain-containing protein [Bacteroidia bacterium]
MFGYQLLARGEIMRTKYRNSFSNPEPLKVDSANYVEFTLPDVAHTFLKGHKIMIQIQSSWFPLFDRNPQTFTNIYTCDESAFKPCTIQLLETEPHKSYIQAPVLKNP